MKKITLVLAILFSLNLSASTPLITWECEGIKVTFNDNNTMTIGELTYSINFSHRTMYLCQGNTQMFHVINDGSGGLIFNYSLNNKEHTKHFTKCM